MSPHHRAALRDERGFTLIEVLITASVGIVVLFAILGASEIFGKSVTTVDRTAGAQDTARTTMRTMVATMRQARFAPPIAPATEWTSPISAASAPSRNNLTFAAYVPSASGAATEKGWVHYCTVDSGTQSSLVMGVRTGDAFVAPAATCSVADTTNGWSHRLVLDRTLRNPEKLFDYTASTCTVTVPATDCLPAAANVQTVGIRLIVGTSQVSAGTFSSVVRDAVSFRNRSGS